MQVTTPIADAIANYRFNEQVLNNVLPVITSEEAFRRPSEHSNHALWILGHMIYTRTGILSLVGKEGEWSRPWLPLFPRGAELLEDSVYPEWPELVAAWNELTPILHHALEEAPQAILDKPGPDPIPSTDGKISGNISFFAGHEAYHTGQLGFLTTWLGHARPVG